MRMMGKREIGKLTIFDFVVSFMIADLSAMVLENNQLTLIDGIIPILTIVSLQFALSFIMLKSKKVRDIIDGKPTVLIQNGKILDNEMAKSRYNLDDLLMQLREKNISSISDVEFAILETSGKLSVFPKTEKAPITKEDVFHRKLLNPFRLPVAVIVEGKVQDDGLNKLGKDQLWLKKELQKQGINQIEQVFYASIDEEGELFVDIRDNRS